MEEGVRQEVLGCGSTLFVFIVRTYFLVIAERRAPVTWFEVAVEHGFAAHVVFVRDFLSGTVVVLQVGAVNGSDQRLIEMKLIDLMIDDSETLLKITNNQYNCDCFQKY